MTDDERELWLRYVGLLGAELRMLAGLAATHGFECDAANVELGKRLREQLGIMPEDQAAAYARAKQELMDA